MTWTLDHPEDQSWEHHQLMVAGKVPASSRAACNLKSVRSLGHLMGRLSDLLAVQLAGVGGGGELEEEGVTALQGPRK